MFLPTLLFVLVLSADYCSAADEPCAVDITPTNTYPIADQYVANELNTLLARVHRLATLCGAQMRERHRINEEQNLRVVQSVGVTGNFQQIADARMYWALDFVNFVEKMVLHKQIVTNRLLKQLEQRIGLGASTVQTLRNLRRQSTSVLVGILYRCRQEVTGTVKAAIKHERILHDAALADCNQSALQQWQLALEADAVEVSERLQQVIEANLEDGYRLLDGFDRRYREIIGESESC